MNMAEKAEQDRKANAIVSGGMKARKNDG